ncbi:hypothetical protein CHUAL_006201 [Chamberlinius hualienensis]
MPSDASKEAPKPRLCHLIKWEDFNGYGFNLHADKSKQGQLIGKVDEGSPAESAGLREGDRIVEVNGVNVSNENHKQVVERIKAVPSETKLLVVDLEAEKYYKHKKIVIKSSMANVVYKRATPTSGKQQSPPPQEMTLTAADDNNEHSNGQEQSNVNDAEDRRSRTSSDRESLHHEADKLSLNGSNLSTPPIGRNGDGSHSSTPDSPSTPPISPTSSPAILSDSNGRPSNLNLNMTASEMRALLANKKKYDPKKENLDLKKKHAIIQGM